MIFESPKSPFYPVKSRGELKRKFSIDQATDTLQYLGDHAGTMTLRCQESKKKWNRILCHLCLHQVKTPQKNHPTIKSNPSPLENKQHHVFKTLIKNNNFETYIKHIFTSLFYSCNNHRHVACVPRYGISLETRNCYRCEEVQGLSPWITAVSHTTLPTLVVLL